METNRQTATDNENQMLPTCTGTNTSEEKTTEKKIKAAVEYLNEHIGLISLCVTIFVGISAIIIKFFLYIYECGRFSYWGIDRSDMYPVFWTHHYLIK